ncbi:hypothetical protein [Niastella caeni]|uniref:hypothetical protein n=1 Tax=Niastella caeni TaxID=2569763 RepID=UPI00129ABCFE|nr:hypothetical protein [Niastella caeni]
MFKEYKKLSWFFIWALLMAGGMMYANYSGYRIFTFNSQQQWNAGGPGYHK